MAKLKIEKVSKVILFWMVAAVAILTAVNYFTDAEGALALIAPAFVFGTALFVFAEVGYLRAFKNKDVFRIGGAVIAMVAMVGVIIELIPSVPTIEFLQTIKGLMAALLAIYFVVEGFR